MSSKLRMLLVGALATMALGAVAQTAAAAPITTTGGSYTATTQALQVLTTTIFGIPTTISCNQTLVLEVLAGTYDNGSLPVGYVRSATFSCNGGDTVTTLPATLAGLPSPSWPIGINTADSRNILATALNVRISATDFDTGVTCLFQGSVGFEITNGSTIGTLLGARFTRVSGICGATGSISGVNYNVAPSTNWT